MTALADARCATADASRIPAEMRAERRWVLHRDKVPYRVGEPYRKASSTDASTWGTFDAAVADYKAGNCDGIGFVLGDGWTGADLDKCRKLTGEIAPTALAIVNGLNSYTEISLSGTGLHIICRGSLPPEGRKSPHEPEDAHEGGIELYDRARYFTVTGWHVNGTPSTVEERTAELASLHAHYFPNGNVAAPSAVGESIPEGQRDNTLTSLAGTMWKRGISEGAILAALRAENAAKCTPPLPDADVQRIARGIARYDRPAHDIAAVEHGRMVAEAIMSSNGNGRHRDSDTLPRAVRGLDAPPPEPLRYIVQPALIAAEYHMLCGEGGAGKTTWAVAVAAAVAGGHRLFEAFDVAAAPVYFVSEEDSAGIVLNRMEALCIGHGWDRAGVLGNVHVLAQASASLNDAAWQVHLVAEVRRTGARLLVLDNLAELSTGQENDNNAAKTVNRFIRRLIAETGCAVLLIHHVSKPADGKRKIDRVRGATAITNAARAIYWIEALGDGMSVESLKYNRGRKPDAYLVALNVEEAAPGTWRSATMRCANLPAAFVHHQSNSERLVPDVREFLRQHSGSPKWKLKKGVSGDDKAVDAAFELLCLRGEARYEAPEKRGMAGRCFLVEP